MAVARSTSLTWILIARAVLSAWLAVYALGASGAAFNRLALAWGVYVVLDGLLAIAAMSRFARRDPRFTAFLAQGFWSLAVGLLALILPYTLYFLLLALIPLWAVVNAVLVFAGVVRTRGLVEHAWLVASAGMIALAAAVLFLSNPAGGAEWMRWILGAYAIVNATILLLFVSRRAALSSRV
jgi:uncharacterized membrane protein HdeD (DUF308 family)